MSLIKNIWAGLYSVPKIFFISCGIIVVYLVILIGIAFVIFYLQSDFLLLVAFYFIYYFPLFVIIISIKGMFTSAKGSRGKISAAVAILPLLLFTAMAAFIMEFFMSKLQKIFSVWRRAKSPIWTMRELAKNIRMQASGIRH